MFRLIFVLIIFLLFIWRVKRGFANGIMKEIVTILSGVISLICVALIAFEDIDEVKRIELTTCLKKGLLRLAGL